jgi:hypothetical protein
MLTIARLKGTDLIAQHCDITERSASGVGLLAITHRPCCHLNRRRGPVAIDFGERSGFLGMNELAATCPPHSRSSSTCSKSRFTLFAWASFATIFRTL